MGLRPGHSAVGSASALGAEGREFESRCPDQLDLPIHQELTPDGFYCPLQDNKTTGFAGMFSQSSDSSCK